MVDLDPATAPRPDAAADPLEALGLELVRLGRIVHMMKSHSAGVGPPGLDQATFGLLMTLIRGGPRRQGELAEAALLDPSTVSRHVAQLVKAGLVERRADAADGRAVQLCASAAGQAVGDQLVARRRRLVQEVLGSWPTEDVDTLAGLLRRFNTDMEASRDLLKAWPAPAAPTALPHDTESREN